MGSETKPSTTKPGGAATGLFGALEAALMVVKDRKATLDELSAQVQQASEAYQAALAEAEHAHTLANEAIGQILPKDSRIRAA